MSLENRDFDPLPPLSGFKPYPLPPRRVKCSLHGPHGTLNEMPEKGSKQEISNERQKSKYQRKISQKINSQENESRCQVGFATRIFQQQNKRSLPHQ